MITSMDTRDRIWFLMIKERCMRTGLCCSCIFHSVKCQTIDAAFSL